MIKNKKSLKRKGKCLTKPKNLSHLIEEYAFGQKA